MDSWRNLSDAQCGMLARRQLNDLGIDSDGVRNQVRAGRWVARTSTVISTFTGEPPWRAEIWRAVLHAGGDALVGGISALEWYGVRNWHRDEITVLVNDDLSFDPVPGINFFRTRRPLDRLRNTRVALPIARLEPAVLICAGYEKSARTAQGMLAAVVQQRLTTAEDLLAEMHTLRPLRRAKQFRRVLSEVAGGAQSLGELDVSRMCRRHGLPAPARQTKRRDSFGKLRFTDAEWHLRDGRTLILEVDGSFHMDVDNWEADLARQRQLTDPNNVIVRCTTRELRDEPGRVARDLLRLGLARLSA